MPIRDVLYKVPTIRKMWRAGHNQEIKHDNINFLEVCNDIQKCMKKVPLSTTSILITGAIRTYTNELDELLNDLIKLDNDLIRRNKRKPFDEDVIPESSTPSSRLISSNITSTMPKSTEYSSSTTVSASTGLSASISQETSTSHAASTSNTGSLISQSSSQSKSASELGSVTHLRSVSQPRSTSQLKSASPTACEEESISQPDSTSQLESGCESRSVTHLRSTSQPRSTSHPKSACSTTCEVGSAAQQESTCQPESTSQSESGSKSGSASQPASEDDSAVQQESTSPPESTSQPESPRLDQTQNLEDASNYEVSPTYTTSITEVKYTWMQVPSLSTIFEETESSSIQERIKSIETPTEINRTKDELMSRKRQNSHQTEESKEDSLEKNVNFTNEGNHTMSDLDRAFITDEITEDSNTNVEDKSEKSVILETMSKGPQCKKRKTEDDRINHMTDAAVRIDQETQVSPRSSEAGFDKDLPFGSLCLYGPCQCNPRIPCSITYSAVEF